MAKLPMTKAALQRALAEIHPAPEIAREFAMRPWLVTLLGAYAIRSTV
jgi:hypothetical protein